MPKVVCRVALTLGTVLLGAGVVPAATLRVTPPSGSRFLVDQRFDVRVEADSPAQLAGVRLLVDGQPLSAGVLQTDAYGRGWNARARSFRRAGPHELRAVDAAGNEVVSKIEVIDPFGEDGRFDPGAAFGDDGLRGGVRNVIILLGDGMGASHRTAARLMRYGVEGGRARGPLAMDRMPGTGLVMTASLNSIITDSAPGMSNYVTGNKANNNQEGVFPDNTLKASADADSSKSFDNPRVEYLSEYLHRKRGKSLGIVTTADVEDATPAANAVHTADRNAGTGIADQYLDESFRTGLAVLMGGGRRWFVPSSDPSGYSSRSKATDYVLPSDLMLAYGATPGALDPTRNLIGDFKGQGFTYVETRGDLKAIPGDTTRLLGLFAWGNMNVAYDKVAAQRGDTKVVDAYRAPDQPMLDEMAEAALQVLDRNPRGFVLMIEGAHIDKQSHLMDAERATWETIEFDRAVAKAVDFARRDGHTLVIVTADHECSGFSIVGASTKTIAELGALPSDTGALAPPTAAAPVRQGAVGTYDLAGFPSYRIATDGYPESLADGFKPLQFGFGANADRFEDWLSKPLPVRDSLLPDGLKAELKSASFPVEPFERSPEGTGGFFIRGQVPGTQAVHTASDIPISSYSSGGDAWRAFVGVQDNTDVFFKLATAALRGGHGESDRGDDDRDGRR